MPINTLDGELFASFLVLGDVGKRNGSGSVKWQCRCIECGCLSYILARDLRKSKFCNCQRSERAARNLITHGMSGKPAHRSWLTMRRRCYDENCRDYPYYGGRGIKVDPSWRYSFTAFLYDMGHPELGRTLDRKDVNGPYCKDTCRWTDHKRQMNNTRQNRVLLFDGEQKTMQLWSEDPRIKALGISYTLLRARLRNGWTIVQAFMTKPGEPRHTVTTPPLAQKQTGRLVRHVRRLQPSEPRPG